MNILNILLNAISPQLKHKVITFIKSLKDDITDSSSEWDQFAVKLLYTLFDI